MNADDFRDYMLSFLFLRYLSDNYETAAKKELGRDYPDAERDRQRRADAAVGLVRGQPRRRGGVREADAPQGALRHQAGVPLGQHRPPGPHAERGAAEHAAEGLQVHRERILRKHLPGAVLGDQPRLGQAGQASTTTATPSSARSSARSPRGWRCSPPTSTRWATPTST